jgi:hypothetical protein
MVNLEMCGGRVEVSAPLQTRVGVATEFVVIGDLIGSGDAQEDGHQIDQRSIQSFSLSDRF